MPKSQQLLTRGEQKLLFFLFLFQPADKSLLRLVGNNYDFTGRQVSSLFNKGYIEEIIIKPKYGSSEKIVCLTQSGFKLISSLTQISPMLIRNNKNRIKGDENKYRQFKLTSLIEMFVSIFPDYINSFINLEENIKTNKTVIEKEILSRREPFLITSREIRDMDEHNLRKITATRSQGIAVSPNTTFILYNHNHKKMRGHGDFEEKFHLYTELLFPKKQIAALHFGRSYKPAIDTLFKTGISQRERFIMSKSIFQNHYFVPLTSSGAKQLQVYFIPNFKEKVCSNILLPEEISRAVNLPYDGEADNGDIIYLGFECNISEIENVLYTLQTVKRNSRIIIYCFKHQEYFYRQVFGEDTTIYPLGVAEVLSSIQ